MEHITINYSELGLLHLIRALPLAEYNNTFQMGTFASQSAFRRPFYSFQINQVRSPPRSTWTHLGLSRNKFVPLQFYFAA